MELCAHHAIQVVLNVMKPKMTPSVASANKAIFLRVQPALTLARQDHGLMMMLETLHNTHNARYVRLVVQPALQILSAGHVKVGMVLWEICAKSVSPSVLSVIQGRMRQNVQGVTGDIILIALQRVLITVLQGIGQIQ